MTPNTRKSDESFEDYKHRLSLQKIEDKLQAQGKVLWPPHKGMYVKRIHGPIGTKD